MPRKLDPRSGFSLVEILMALAVLAIGLAGIFSLFGIATTTHRRATDQSTVGLIAQRARAEVQARFTAGQAGAVTAQTFPEFPGYTYDVETQDLGGVLPSYAVKIVVKWKFRGRETQEVFETVMIAGGAR